MLRSYSKYTLPQKETNKMFFRKEKTEVNFEIRAQTKVPKKGGGEDNLTPDFVIHDLIKIPFIERR